MFLLMKVTDGRRAFFRTEAHMWCTAAAVLGGEGSGRGWGRVLLLRGDGPHDSQNSAGIAPPLCSSGADAGLTTTHGTTSAFNMLNTFP